MAVNVCLRHMVDRPARALVDGERLDLGGRTVRFHATPHVPFWEAGLLCDEASGTLFCGDLFTIEGDSPAVTDADIVGLALDFERRMRHFPVSAHVAPTLRRLAALRPVMLACMHGPAFTGDAPIALQELGAHYDAQSPQVIEAARA